MASARELPNLVITFLLEHGSSFLIVKRSAEESNFPNRWAFPGGKVEVGETIVDTLHREIAEETGLTIGDDFVLLDAYCFGRSTGIAVLVRATSCAVRPSGFTEFAWVASRSDLEALTPRIPGIDNHFVAATRALGQAHWQSLDALQLTQDRYLNQ